MFRKKAFIRLFASCLIPVLMLGGCSSETAATPTEEPTEVTLSKSIMQKSDPKEDNVLNILRLLHKLGIYY